MRTRMLFALLATVWMAVSSCTTMTETTTLLDPHCASANCRMMLLVTNVGGTCQLSDPGTIYVDKGNSPVIEWTLSDTTGVGYQFARNGIAFVVKSGFKAPPEGMFHILGTGPATSFRVKDNHADEKTVGLFNYKITLVKPDGSPGCELDPPIYNGP